ncbi:putative pre-rRNA-processing protein TSR2 [Blattamonas nauphoetae]|uniref:Pre-rRNA-processing protein TSR2 n=1 Tax=Blattamonas nauphoetae TaxID=2049346 RepID=A0ABQ9YMD9_9EUKA|nr:putative pre-rRNA-processing protein TSR2 [Blattamonas nauphoetae]
MDHEKLLNFGIRCILNSWAALRLIVINNFSGDDNDDERMANLVMDIRDTLVTRTNQSLESVFESYLEEDFHTSIEDESIDLISRDFTQLFRTIRQNSDVEIRRVAGICSSLKQGPITQSLNWTPEEFTFFGLEPPPVFTGAIPEEPEYILEDEDNENSDDDEEEDESEEEEKMNVDEDDGWETAGKKRRH